MTYDEQIMHMKYLEKRNEFLESRVKSLQEYLCDIEPYLARLKNDKDLQGITYEQLKVELDEMMVKYGKDSKLAWIARKRLFSKDLKDPEKIKILHSLRYPDNIHTEINRK